MQAFLKSFKRARFEREDKHGGLDLGAFAAIQFVTKFLPGLLQLFVLSYPSAADFGSAVCKGSV